jgi:glycine/D-amino acid oxidase-like deaminating enzyme
MTSADVVVCGAGIAGVATAHFLTVEMGVERVVLCDPRPPLSLTSDKSTECYRNWWPNGPMVGLMNRSIDLLERQADLTNNAFHLNRRGYLYVTADSDRARHLEATGREIAQLGAGTLRVHNGRGSGLPYQPEDPSAEGGDLIIDQQLIRSHFPYLTDRTVAVLHARRAGWFSAQQLGTVLLEAAQDAGLSVLARRVTGVDTHAGRVQSVSLDDGSVIRTPSLVNAAGPLIGEVAAMFGEALPVTSELHLKVAFKEHRRVIPPTAPLLIWSDPQRIDWSSEVAELFGADSDTRFLLDELPAACHGRPEGAAESPYVLALWEYRRRVMNPVWPVPLDPRYPEVVMRGMSTMVPGLAVYRTGLPASMVDGGYYTKTEENLPLIGPMATGGAFVVGALSGFGVMAAAAAGELAALHVTGAGLPQYASAFHPARYQDPGYLATLRAVAGDDGQL